MRAGHRCCWWAESIESDGLRDYGFIMIRRSCNPPRVTRMANPNPPCDVRHAMIEIKRTADADVLEFEVIVRNGTSKTRHQVTMAPALCQRLCAGKHTPEQCIDAAFRFLLDREPKK